SLSFTSFQMMKSVKTKIHAKLYRINENIIRYNGENPKIKNNEEAESIISELKLKSFFISDVQHKETKRNAPLPFTTSVMQQSASSKLGFSPKKTMLLAQKLYEGIEIKKGEGNIGLITYMRTDSNRISTESINAAAHYIKNKFGDNYLSRSISKSKSSKSLQDAHEAIRPTDVNITPDKLKHLDSGLYALYNLIWKRFLSSQMAPAIYNQKTILINSSKINDKDTEYIFKSTGRDIKFDGFLKIYSDLIDEPANGIDEIEFIPEGLAVKDKLITDKYEKEQHFTSPAARYSESSLIKQLDNLGIGRPSTFALIVSTVIDRKYVNLEEKRLFATELGMQVNKILQAHFPDVINTEFTANMEVELDTIANGESSYKEVLDDFYKPFHVDLLEAESKASEIKKSLIVRTNDLCPECGKETNAVMLKKWGRNGLFYTCERYPKCKATRSIESDINKIAVNVLCDKCGSQMVEKIGPYGRFYGCSKYPECDGIKPITLGIKCPKCKTGEILLRRGGKRKRLFYGCTNFPECNFIENNKPIMEKCKECGNEYMLLKTNKRDGEHIQCPKCKHKEIIPKQ
ncbi:MAG: DNA topoisomerase, partial [Candidatus Thorarchaeota archaeon]